MDSFDFKFRKQVMEEYKLESLAPESYVPSTPVAAPAAPAPIASKPSPVAAPAPAKSAEVKSPLPEPAVEAPSLIQKPLPLPAPVKAEPVEKIVERPDDFGDPLYQTNAAGYQIIVRNQGHQCLGILTFASDNRKERRVGNNASTIHLELLNLANQSLTTADLNAPSAADRHMVDPRYKKIAPVDQYQLQQEREIKALLVTEDDFKGGK